MAKFSIDLLPLEFKAEEIKRTKFYKIQVIGVVTILILAFASSLTIALRILQSQNLSQIQSRLSQTERRVSELQTTQTSLLVLKSRLAIIGEYLGTQSEQAQIYTIVSKLLPAEVVINGISISQSGEVSLTAVTQDSDSLDRLIDNLLSPQQNQGKISKVSLETFSRGKDGIYRLSLRIEPKL